MIVLLSWNNSSPGLRSPGVSGVPGLILSTPLLSLQDYEKSCWSEDTSKALHGNATSTRVTPMSTVLSSKHPTNIFSPMSSVLLASLANTFVAACRTCSQQTISHCPAVDLLNHCHTDCGSLDFITGFPVSDKITVFMNVVDHFSKFCHFIPCSALPSVKEMGCLLIHDIFCLHGLTVDVMLDRGPQFTSAF